jgi:CheY-like chemotaxis protein
LLAEEKDNMAQYRVWFVDDLPSNRKRFEENHRDDFAVRTFERPSEVLDAIQRDGPPDALLCDIYFYDTVSQAEQIEAKVSEEAERLRTVANSINANRDEAQQGIGLLEEVSRLFHGKPPFPVYAYTSKGPYLLGGPALDRIARSGARWILKGKFDAGTERWVIDRDIRDLKSRRWRNAIWRSLWIILIGTGVLGWFVGKTLEGIFLNS